MLDKAMFWLTLGGIAFAVGFGFLGIAALETIPEHHQILESGWARPGITSFVVAAVLCLWALVLKLAHAHAETHMREGGAGSGLTFLGPVNQVTVGGQEMAPNAAPSARALPPNTSHPPAWLDGDTYDHCSLRVADLPMEESTVKGKTFRGCTIYGPAVVAFLGRTSVIGCQWTGTVDAVLWELPADRQRVIGAVGMLDCEFSECTFVNVGVAGPQELIAKFRADFER